jgi:ribosomal protein L7/L12
VAKSIRQYTGLGLAEAKKCTDKILARDVTEFEIPELHTAEAFLADMNLSALRGKYQR